MPPLLPEIASDAEYRRFFRDATAGLDAARHLCARHNLAAEPERLVAGSNLVFRVGEGLWMKIFPTTFADEGRTERWMLEHICPLLPVRTPELVATGEIDGWDYVVLTHIDGVGYDVARDRMHADDRERIASEVGHALRALHTLSTRGFARSDAAWEPFIEAQIASVATRVAASGADARWIELASAFIGEHADELRAQASRVITHADLYFDHLLVIDVGGRWEIAGIIDFADAVVAPREYDLVDPLLWLFRGERRSIRALMLAFGYAEVDLDEVFAERMLAFAVTHRFPRFADAFKHEIADPSITSMEALAHRVFP